MSEQSGWKGFIPVFLACMFTVLATTTAARGETETGSFPIAKLLVGEERLITTQPGCEISGQQDLEAEAVLLAHGTGTIEIWESFELDTDSWGIFGRLVDPTGRSTKGPFRVNTVVKGVQQSPEVAHDPSGGFLVVWESSPSGQSDGPWAIFARLFDKSGEPLGEDFRLDSERPGSRRAPKVRLLHDLGYEVTWESYDSDGVFLGTYGRLIQGDLIFEDGFETGSFTVWSGVASGPIAVFSATEADPGGSLEIHFDASGSFDPDGSIAGYLWDFGDGTLGSDVAPIHVYPAHGTYLITLSLVDNQGLTATVSATLHVFGPLSGLALISPPDGEVDVTVSRKPNFRFSRPLAPETLNPTDISVRVEGGLIAATAHLSTVGDVITLFFEDPLPADSQVAITIDGNSLRNVEGGGVDIDGDGRRGGIRTFSFHTVSLATAEGTKVCGRVLASNLAVGGGEEPLVDAEVTVDGAEGNYFSTTDVDGNFCLDPAPIGRFFARVDGRTATNAVPEGAYYPTVVEAWQGISSSMVHIGNTYLPLIASDSLQPVSNTTSTVITFPPSVLAARPELAGTSIVVPAGSLFGDDGTIGGMVGIAPVSPDRLPAPLPPGLEPALVITVQTDGGSNFDIPAPICFPNLPDTKTGEQLAAGAKSGLWSFNHEAGRWELSGPMTVSADGLLVCTDPGVGIRAPGWHVSQPTASASGGGGTSNPSTGGPPDPYDDPNVERDPNCPSVLSSCPQELFDRIGSQSKCILKVGTTAIAVAATVAAFFPEIALIGVGTLSVVIAQSQAIASFAEGDNLPAAVSQASVLSRFGGIVDSIYGVNQSIEACEEAGQRRDALEACEANSCQGSGLVAFGAFSGATLTRTVPIPSNLEDEQALLFEANRNFLTAFYGGSQWSDVEPKDLQILSVFNTTLIEAMALESELAAEISFSEGQALLRLPLPTGLTQADAVALISRLNSFVRNELPQSEVENLVNAASTLASIAVELEGRGWSTTIDLFTRGSLRVDANVVEQIDPHSQFYKLTTIGPNSERRGFVPSQGFVESLILAPETVYAIEYLSPTDLKVAQAVFLTGPAGSNTNIPRSVFFDQSGPDSDGDGLTDTAESIAGTRSDLGDTDGDGTSDRDEVVQGTDPFGRDIQIGEVISAAISNPFETDRYSFPALANQKIYFDLQVETGVSAIRWSAAGSNGTELFSTCLGCGDPGVRTVVDGGTYTITVGGNASQTGVYQFQVWNVPAPDSFSIQIGDLISDSVPGPGAGRIETPGVRDVYTFTASPGQVVYFDVLNQTVSSIPWEVKDAAGTVVSSQCLGCGDPGIRTLSLGGSYTITVGSNNSSQVGTYSVQVWDVPAPDSFSIQIGDVISNGVPGPGAGRIETPGVRDVYTFTASPGQVVYFDLLNQTGTSSIAWVLRDASSTVIFSTCLGCGDPGVRTLNQGGSYTITIGGNNSAQTGTYSFQMLPQ